MNIFEYTYIIYAYTRTNTQIHTRAHIYTHINAGIHKTLTHACAQINENIHTFICIHMLRKHVTQIYYSFCVWEIKICY